MPIALLQEILAVAVLTTKWRLERLRRIEALVYSRRAISVRGVNCGSAFAFLHEAGRTDAFSIFRGYQEGLSRTLYNAYRELRKSRQTNPTNLAKKKGK